MGYDVHITRKENWFDEEGPSISLEEWISLVGADPGMLLEGFAEAATPSGEKIRVESEGLSVWTAYSGHGKDGNMAWFDLRAGCVVVKNPDEEILKKMYEIARRLGAKVQGDDGEVYGSDGNLDDFPLNRDPAGPRKPWWKFW